jgi:hypothetical protein
MVRQNSPHDICCRDDNDNIRNGVVMNIKVIPDNAVEKRIMERVSEVQKKGFGEVVIMIRNGYIHRIKVSDEEYINNREKGKDIE